MRSLFFSAGEDIHPSSVQHDFQASSLMQHGINAWQELYQCSSVHGGNNENMDVYQDLNSFPLGKYEELHLKLKSSAT
uniref:Putative ovule protein n=1 Tax=Solanum chacoense TaxID=4108 RepID=A0A0V0HDU0_SOLCH